MRADHIDGDRSSCADGVDVDFESDVGAEISRADEAEHEVNENSKPGNNVVYCGPFSIVLPWFVLRFLVDEVGG